MIKKLLYTSLLILMFAGRPAYCITETDIEKVIDRILQSHPIRFGAFRIQPALAIGSGYDNNTLGTSADFDPIPSYYFAAIPRGSFALKLGNRGYLDLVESLTFLYYQEPKSLRDIFNSTSLTVGTGTRKMILTLNGGYVNRKNRISFETDVPASEKITSGRSTLAFAIRDRTAAELMISVAEAQYEPLEDTPPEVPLPVDHTIFETSATVTQVVGTKFGVSIRGLVGKLRFNDPGVTEPNRDYYRVFPGLNFFGERLKGNVFVGYGVTDSASEFQGRFSDLLVQSELTYAFRERLTIGGGFNRDRRISSLLQDSFLLLTEFTFQATIPLSRKFMINEDLRIGKNDYGENFFIGQEPVTKDNYLQWASTFLIRLPKSLRLGLGGTYYKRDSTSETLSKNRFVFNVGLSMGVD